MEEPFQPPRRCWPKKFGDAIRAGAASMRGEASFHVHLVVALLVAGCGIGLGVGRIEACLLALCVFGVLAAEMFNTALERLAKAVDHRENPHLAAALNIGSAAVLTAVVGACLVGATIFLFRLGVLLGWWAA